MNENKIVSYIGPISDNSSVEQPMKLSAKDGGFSEKELKRAKKALKKAGVPKPWLITLTNDEGESIVFEL